MQLRIKADEVNLINVSQGSRTEDHLTAMGRKKRLINKKCHEKSAVVGFLNVIMFHTRGCAVQPLENCHLKTKRTSSVLSCVFTVQQAFDSTSPLL